MKNNFEIIDDGGVIHSGTESEMLLAFQVMQNDFTGLTGLVEKRRILTDRYSFPWKGDLKLVQVHKITR